MLNRISSALLATAFVLVAILAGLEITNAEDQRSEDDVEMRVAIQRDPSTLNILAQQDEWAQRVLAPVHDTVIHVDPKTEELLPYILKGTDANGNGAFDVNEYGIFTSIPGKPLEVRGFYDFNGVRFHDGYQATVDDLLFTYHLHALNPNDVALNVLKDGGNLPGTNYTTTRWLHLWELRGFDPAGDWQFWRDDYSDPDYNNSLRAAVHFVQQRPYASFFRRTLAWDILPAHVWEGTGCLYERDTTSFRCGLHEFPGGDPSLDNFGVAYDKIRGNGVPRTDPNAFDYGLAEYWDPSPETVIGTGPFALVEWIKGKHVSLERNEEYFVGEPGIHKPNISGMIFQIFKTTQTAVFALKSGDIDFIGWSIPPSFLDELEQSPNVGIVVSDERTFTYLGFNMRNEPFGYSSGDPGQGDVGANFRRAVSHLIDKSTIVSSLLQTFGTVGDGIIHPESVWHNDSLPAFSYDPDMADVLLDTYDPWEPTDGPCRRDGSGCRSFPVVGTQGIGIMTPDAGFDPWRAASGTLIIQAMNDAGINAMSVPGTLGNLNARDFQMFIMNWIIDSYPPDLFSTLLYSRNAAQGLNYMGYQSDSFDEIILTAQEELDHQRQIDLIEDAQGVVANDRPCDVLYFPKNIEAYRSDRFTNWTEGLWGSIYNHWSWLGVEKTPPDSLRISTSIQSAIETKKITKFTATVRDPIGRIVQDATVQVYVPPGDGSFIWGSTQSNAVSGQTDLNGQFKVTYDSPDLDPLDSKRTVMIYAKASHPEYPDSRNASTSIVVYPPGATFLVLLIDMTMGDLVIEGRSTVIGVRVTDQDEHPVQTASVTIHSDPFAEISQATGLTDVNGYINGVDHFEFKAPQVERNQDFNVSILAEKSGYEPAERSFTISVIDSVTQTDPPSSPLMLTLAVGLVVAVAIFAVAIWISRKRRGKDTRE